MAETLRTVSVSVEIDTNKDTYRQTFELGEDETRLDLSERVTAFITREL